MVHRFSRANRQELALSSWKPRQVWNTLCRRQNRSRGGPLVTSRPSCSPSQAPIETKTAMHRFILFLAAVLMTAAPAWSQDDQRNRSRDARGLAGPQGREGGIPRGQVQRGNGQAEASQEGTEEG